MKKIMFNDKYGLTQAVLEGRKTMTRRIVPNKIVDEWADYLNTCAICNATPLHVIECSNYKVGEIVAVAQSYNDIVAYRGEQKYLLGQKNSAGWHNKMFVKAFYMPHYIRITNIRVERLQDISDSDCLREGLKEVAEGFVVGGMVFHNPKHAFEALIDKISRKGTWDSNPWVFVYDFELVD